MSDPRSLGVEAEDQAADHLLSKGYTLLARRYRVRGGEVDLVALDGEELVFVEVKLRRTGFQTPEAAVGARKVRRFQIAAERFAQEHGLEGRVARYDLVAIERGVLTHHVDAFRIGTPLAGPWNDPEDENVE